jgi:hypothetical protein
MTDPDEAQPSKLAKKMLSMPPKKHEDSKVGKPKTKPAATRGTAKRK